MECFKTNKWYKELLSFSTAIVLTISIIMIGFIINHFLSDKISFVLFFASPFLFILSIYIAYRLTKVLNSRFTCLNIIMIILTIVVLLIIHIWMEQNLYPRGDNSSGGMCGSSNELEIYSPNKTKKAIVYLYDCGATTDYNTRITLADANDTLEDTPLSADIYGIEGAGIDKITWLNNNQLLIEHNLSRQVFYSDNEFNGIKIDFRPIN